MTSVTFRDENLRRLADSILGQPGAWPSPEQTRQCEQFLCGQSSPVEKRVVVRELLHRAGRRSEEG